MAKTKKVRLDLETADTKEAIRAWDKFPSVPRKIRAYFDANIPSDVAERIRKNLGWDVLAVQERQELKSQSDEFHYHNARKLKRTFFTLDKHFLNDHRFPLHRSPGTFVLIADQSNSDDIYWAIECANIHLAETVSKMPSALENTKTCVSLEGTRIRFLSKDSQVTEIIAPWFPMKVKQVS